MGTRDSIANHCGDFGSLERLRYFPRQLLTADDMRTEQEYFRERQKRHNRLLHGWGVVCGLEVVLDKENGPFAVRVCPGYALGPYGDEIYVPESVPLDLIHCAPPPEVPCEPMHPVQQPLSTTPIIVRIAYAECPTRPIRTLPAGCGCDETACEYSRIRDGFEVQCVLLPEKPEKLQAASELAPTGKVRPCPPWPSDPWVLLAKISPSKKTDDGVVVVVVDETSIHNEVRKVV
jgi:hypothetical protein